MAPTAPHGTVAEHLVRVGPIRFWDRRRARIAFQACIVASAVAHYVLSPWTLIPVPPDVEFKDVDDELTIPIDMLSEEEAPPPPSTRDIEPPPPKPGEGPGLDGGARSDAGPSDAGVRDAAPPPPKPRRDAGLPLADLDGGGTVPLAANLDAGAGEAGTAPMGAPGGLASIVTGGEVNIDLLMDVDVIRQHPLGTKMGLLLGGIPQWKEFLHGAETKFDPIQHTNWIHIYGPSLIHTDRDAVQVHYSAPDEMVDKAIDLMAERTPNGGVYDAGVPGVRAHKGFADNAERVILRVRPNEIVIVPPAKAAEFAKVLSKRAISPKRVPGEAMRIIIRNPSRQISIPDLHIKPSLKELRIRIVPNKDGSATVYAEGDCADEAAATELKDDATGMFSRMNDNLAVRLATGGLLGGAVVTAEGNRILVRMPATAEQLQLLLKLAALRLNVQLPPD